MRFANSYFLYALWLLPLPFIIHFFFIRNAKKEEYSPFFLIERALKKSERATNLKKILILLLRSLILFSLIFAFAAPIAGNQSFLRRFLSGAVDSRNIKAVFLVDRSYSARRSIAGKSVYEAGKNALSEILAGFKNKDKACVVFFSGRVENEGAVLSGNFQSLQNAVKSSKPGFGETDLEKALKEAFKILARERGGKKIIFIDGDMAASGIKSGDFNLKNIPYYDKSVKIASFDFPKARGNFYVSKTALDFTKGLTLKTTIKNPMKARGELKAEIASETFLAKKKVSFGANEIMKEIKFRIKRPRKEFFGKALIKTDALAVDNVFYYVFADSGRKKNILALYSRPSDIKAGYGAYFIEKLFANSPRFFLKISEFGKVGIKDMKSYDGIIFFGSAVSGAEKIEKYVSGGGFCWFIPSSLDSDSDIKKFFKLWGIRFKRFESGNFQMKPALSDSFFKNEDFSGFEIEKAKVSKIARADFSGFKVLWNFSNYAGFSRPALIYGKHKKGKIAFFASSFDLNWSNIAVKPFFSQFIFQSFDFFLAPPLISAKKILNIGENFKLKLPESYFGKIKITGPDGKIFTKYPENGNFSFTPSRPGIYIWNAGGLKGRFAVNIYSKSGESDLREIKNGFSVKIPLANAPEEFRAAVQDAGLWNLFALLAGFFILSAGFLSERL